LWLSVLLVEETGVPGESHRPVASHWQTSSHNVVSSTPQVSGIRAHVSGKRNSFQNLKVNMESKRTEYSANEIVCSLL
jgi:hypothetical protein